MQIEKLFGSKKIGYLNFSPSAPIDENSVACRQTKDCFVILHLKKGSRVTVDFIEYDIEYVERFYNKYHTVADYADLLNISLKVLNRRIVQEKKESPNLIIKNRIILQAKRLLIHTELSIKEIAAQLGYDDVSYFVRFFKIQTGISPLVFRKEHSLAPA